MKIFEQLAGSGRTEIVAVAIGAAGLLVWLHYLTAVWRESLRSRKEISRYPMFAARDRLVRLVVDGEMSDQDPAWRATYASVTELLKMHQRLHVVDVVSRFAQYILEALANPVLRDRVQRLDTQLKRAKKNSPAFAEVSTQIEKAFHRMVEMRSSAVHRLAVRAYLMWFRLRLRLIPPTIGVVIVERRRSEVRRIRRAYAGGVSRALNPNSAEIAGFAQTEACAA